MSEPTSKQLVVFSLGSEEYALPIVIVSSGAGQIGVMVDAVEEVLTAEASQLEDVPTAKREAIAKIGGRLVVLLNADGLFAREAEQVLAAA